ncbi:MAG: hypothetical protein GY771_14030 [bacterium]|nr:hypothetical protein [bacterium]
MLHKLTLFTMAVVLGLVVFATSALATFDPDDGDCWRGYSGYAHTWHPSSKTPQYLASHADGVINTEAERAKIRTDNGVCYTHIDNHSNPYWHYFYLMLDFTKPDDFHTADLRWEAWGPHNNQYTHLYFWNGVAWRWIDNMYGIQPGAETEYVEDYFGDEKLLVLMVAYGNHVPDNGIWCDVGKIAYDTRLSIDSKSTDGGSEAVYGTTGIEGSSLGGIKATFK